MRKRGCVGIGDEQVGNAAAAVAAASKMVVVATAVEEMEVVAGDSGDGFDFVNSGMFVRGVSELLRGSASSVFRGLLLDRCQPVSRQPHGQGIPPTTYISVLSIQSRSSSPSSEPPGPPWTFRKSFGSHSIPFSVR